MDTPTRYADICEKALKVREELGLTDTQTLLYNHICRGDFRLRNEDGQLFYDKENNGFGWSGSREWVKKQFNPLLKAGLVKFESRHDCRDGKYTSWYFYDAAFELDSLVDATCYVRTWKLASIKKYFNLPDGFDKNGEYGDIRFEYKKNKGYTFYIKGIGNLYYWDHECKGKKEGGPYPETRYEEEFSNLVHNIFSTMVSMGYKQKHEIPGYTHKRQFSIK